MTHLEAFRKRKDLIDKYGEGNAHQLWCMAAYLDEPDIDKLAADGLTDGSGDKKIDFLYVQNSTLYIAQGYYTANGAFKVAASANKASDLNAGLAWLTVGDLDDVPEKLRTKISEVRALLESEELDGVELLYTHNCGETENVRKELETCAAYLRNAFAGKEILVTQKELGCSSMEKLYIAYSQQIVVRESVEFDGQIISSQEGDGWKAHIGFVNGRWLYELFQKHGNELFSANYRGFMGMSRRKKINNAIRATAENAPNDFFVFNNGISILTTSVSDDLKTFEGISIINGAQTTGSVSSATDLEAIGKISVLCKVIVCNDPEKVKKIVEYNNTQNYITTWDHYSNSPEQKQLELEFSKLGHTYSLKRGFDSAAAEIGIEIAAQPLVALHGDYVSANRGKNYVFETKTVYDSAFHETKAQHLLVAVAVSKAIEHIKKELNDKATPTEQEKTWLAFLQGLRSKNFVIAVVGALASVICGKPLNAKTVKFTYHESLRKNNEIESLVIKWVPVIKMVLPFVVQGIGEDFAAYLDQENALKRIVDQVGTQLGALRAIPSVEATLQGIAVSVE
ncbi:hypothetical protein GCT13_44060 [Paraburkholderia sp. CNPSo 3157]|uniref:Abortive phage infection protein C-terminal domain-containing protein n=2 Tax=Paraburkholderia franconis TaxID=2654983 RepID=A0A7X1NL88_9BURK|nr:hypothetical protein [Paraburkholderia franconis]